MAFVPAQAGEREGRLLGAFPKIGMCRRWFRFFIEGRADARALELPPPMTPDELEAYAEENSETRIEFQDRRVAPVEFLTAAEEALANRVPDTEHEIYRARWSHFSDFQQFQPHRSNLKTIEHLADGNILGSVGAHAATTLGDSTMRLRLLDFLNDKSFQQLLQELQGASARQPQRVHRQL